MKLGLRLSLGKSGKKRESAVPDGAYVDQSGTVYSDQSGTIYTDN